MCVYIMCVYVYVTAVLHVYYADQLALVEEILVKLNHNENTTEIIQCQCLHLSIDNRLMIV